MTSGDVVAPLSASPSTASTCRTDNGNLSSPSSPISQWRKITSVAVLITIYFIAFADRYSTAGVIDRIRVFYNVSNTQAGALQTGFIVTYILFEVICGYIGDIACRRHILILSTAAWTVCMIASAFVPKDRFSLFLVIRSLTAIGQAACDAIAPAIIADYFSGGSRNYSIMLFSMMISVGGMAGSTFGSAFMEVDDFRYCFLVAPIFSTAMLFLLCTVVEEPVRGGMEYSSSSGDVIVLSDHSKALSRMRAVLSIKSFWFATATSSAMNYYVTAQSWWSPDLILKSMNSTGKNAFYDFNYTTAMTVHGVTACIAAVVGCIAMVHLAEMWANGTRCFAGYRSERALCTVQLIDCVLFFVFGCLYLYYLDVDFWMLLATETIMVASYSAIFPLAVLIVLDVTHPRIRAVAMAVYNILLAVSGDGLSPISTGAIADHLEATGTASPFAALRIAMYMASAIVSISIIGAILNLVYFTADRDKAKREISESCSSLTNNNA